MRAGLTVSIVGHVAILGFGFIAFPDARPFQADDIEALPVELVSLADLTDLLKGDKNSEVLPEATPQPKPIVEAEAPTPEPAEEPGPKPVEAPPPSPPPPPPEPAPEPEPEPEEVAALPNPAPAEVLEPAPVVPVEPALPRPRPTLPKPVVQPKPAPEPPPTVAEKPQPEFNPDDIAALLNKQEPAGGGDPVPAPEPQTIGSIDGHAGAAMTQSEIEALKARLYRCWNPPPVAAGGAGALVVEVQIYFLPDGGLAGPPRPNAFSPASDPQMQVAIEAAVRAVVQCAPYGDILSPAKIAQLVGGIIFVFDPREMLGG